jgi:hypothetical protein
MHLIAHLQLWASNVRNKAPKGVMYEEIIAAL